MGSKSSKQQIIHSKSLKIEEKDEINLIQFYDKFTVTHNQEKMFNLSLFDKEIFLGCNMNTLYFLNDYYTHKNNKKKINNLDLSDLANLFYLLTKANNNDEDHFTLYFRKNSFLILYDIFIGKVGAFEKEIKLSKLVDVFDFIVKIYIMRIKLQNKDENLKLNYEKNKIIEFLKNNLQNKEENGEIIIDNQNLINFIDNHLYSLDSFIKNYFKIKFLNKEFDENLTTSLPICTDTPSTVSIDQFLFFVLANPNLNSLKFAFKLHDCQKSGYNISNLIYSFIGFPGPVAIFVEHFDKENGKDHVLGAFINSNFKECYEKFCGDDLSYIFTIHPKLQFYKCVGDTNKICFISSKNQKFSKVEPGIGMGFSYGKCRFWIDSNECFKKSYFNKYDDVFEEGTPFDNSEQILNIANIEVFGFGNEDTYESLIKKQNKDKAIIEKMKQVDRAAFADNEFDKEMFFDNTFGHQKYDKRNDM